MPNDGTKIWINRTVTPNIGISVLGDIAYVLGRDTADVGQLCKDVDSSGNPCVPRNINIWSKVKPYELSTKPGPLSASDYYGANTDHSQGIYWGIQISVPDAVNIDNIHSCAFTWAKRPTTWFRVTDFDGYNNSVLPNPYGNISVPAVGYVDTGANGNGKFEGLTVLYYDTNTDGVDFSRILFDDQSFDLTKVYPCIVVKAGNKNYFTALTSLYSNTPKPLKLNNTYPNDPLYADLTKNLYLSNPQQGQAAPPPFAPSSGAEQINTVSLCLMELENGTLLYPDTNEDMALYWFDASDAGLMVSSKVVPVPGDFSIGQLIAFRNAQNGVDVKNTRIVLSASMMSLVFGVLDASMATLTSYNVELLITFTMAGNTTQFTRYTTASEVLSTWMAPNKVLSWMDDFGLAGPPSSQFTLSVQVLCGSYSRTSTYTNVTYSPGATILPD